MDIFQIFLFLSFFCGIAFLIYSAAAEEESAAPSRDFEIEFENGVSVNETLKAIDNSVADADSALNELSDMSKLVFKQFDEKYQELLFLYNLLDEKKQEFTNINPKDFDKIKNNQEFKRAFDKIVSDETKISYKHKRLPEILKLKNSGMSIDEIAKKLNIGKGEVSLILELGKGR